MEGLKTDTRNTEGDSPVHRCDLPDQLPRTILLHKQVDVKQDQLMKCAYKMRTCLLL